MLTVAPGRACSDRVRGANCFDVMGPTLLMRYLRKGKLLCKWERDVVSLEFWGKFFGFRTERQPMESCNTRNEALTPLLRFSFSQNETPLFVFPLVPS